MQHLVEDKFCDRQIELSGCITAGRRERKDFFRRPVGFPTEKQNAVGKAAGGLSSARKKLTNTLAFPFNESIETWYLAEIQKITCSNGRHVI
jgi:hypothetical protein